MNAFTVILLTTLVIGFLYRAAKLYKLIKDALYYLSFNKEMTPTAMQFQSGAVGCMGCICIPSMCFSLFILIYLLFNVTWWIPIVAIITGLTFGNLIGFFIERIVKLPNHGSTKYSSFNLNALELTMNHGQLYRRAAGLMVLYCFTSLIISIVIIFNVK